VDGGVAGVICDVGAVEYDSDQVPRQAPNTIQNLVRMPASIVRGSVPSGPNQWFSRISFDDLHGEPGDPFHLVVWLHVPQDWTLPWATQYSFTGDFYSGPISADAPAYAWVQTPNCALGGEAEPGYKWRAFRGPLETMPTTGDRLDNSVNLRGGLGIPSGVLPDIYQVRVVVGTYYDHDADVTPDSYHCDLISVTAITITD